MAPAPRPGAPVSAARWSRGLGFWGRAATGCGRGRRATKHRSRGERWAACRRRRAARWAGRRGRTCRRSAAAAGRGRRRRAVGRDCRGERWAACRR
eukprot:scaffold20599_cov41-Phaeocystis_antarctica.AAC.1